MSKIKFILDNEIIEEFEIDYSKDFTIDLNKRFFGFLDLDGLKTIDKIRYDNDFKNDIINNIRNTILRYIELKEK